MRVGEGQVEEDGPIGRAVAEIGDRLVDDLLAGFAAGPVLLVVEVLADLEKALDLQGGVAALAVVVGGVSGGLHGGGEVGPVRLGLAAEPEVAPAAQEHVATGQADGRGVAAEAVGGGEGEPGAGDPVEVGRPYGGVAEGRDGVGTLVVGQQDDHVGPLAPRSRGGPGQGGEQGQGEPPSRRGVHRVDPWYGRGGRGPGGRCGARGIAVA